MKMFFIGSIAAALSLSGGSLYAENTKPTIEDLAEQNVFGKWQPRSQSASPNSGFFANLNFLYLRPDVGNLSHIQTIHTSQFVSLDQGLTVAVDPVSLNFHSDPGLSIGIGYIIPQRQQWEVSGNWTYFHSKADASTSTPGNDSDFLQISWLPLLLGTVAQRSTADWHLNFNLMDIALSRSAYFGSYLSVKPQIGIRAAWINQDYRAKYHRARYQFVDSGTPVSIYRNTKFVASNDYWGVGIHTGGDIQWYLNKYLSIIGNLFASLLYGKFDIDQLFDGAIPLDFGAGPVLLPEVVKQSKKYNALRPALESSIGLAWQQFFREETQRLTIAIYYQLGIWFNQNELFNEFFYRDAAQLSATTFANNNNVSSFSQRGHLQLQGLRAQLRYDF